MKAVLLSIRPEWCDLIIRRQKTLEVRRTSPKLETPFKCYVYCTKSKSKIGWLQIVPGKGWRRLDGNIIGEFTCDKIEKLVHVGTMMDINILTSDGWYKPADALLQAACLTEETVKKYLQGRNGYGWHISDLKIYDKPRDLDEFSRFGFLGMGRSNCVCGNRRCENYEPSYHYMIPPTCKIDGCSICRPPQSWCYVEELSNE
jgi:predicted transcriptional regulator